MNVAELRDLVAVALIVLMASAAVMHRVWLRRAIHRLEYDPTVQFHIHRVATWYWAANFPIVAVLFFGFPEVWVRIGLLLNTFYSLYANLATDYGAVSAALAASQQATQGRVSPNVSEFSR